MTVCDDPESILIMSEQLRRSADNYLPNHNQGSLAVKQEVVMLTRRTCLKTIGGGLAAIAAAGSERASAAQTHSKVEPSKLAMPGPYRGRVAAVESPGAILSGKYQPEKIRTMMRRGMVELTGADT